MLPRMWDIGWSKRSANVLSIRLNAKTEFRSPLFLQQLTIGDHGLANVVREIMAFCCIALRARAERCAFTWNLNGIGIAV